MLCARNSFVGLVLKYRIDFLGCRSKSTYRRISCHHSLCRMATTAKTTSWERQVTVQMASKNDPCLLLNVKMTVIDTYPDEILPQKRPVVVALHGLPGEAADFGLLASRLYDEGIRFIAPSDVGVGPLSIDKGLVPHVDFSTEGRVEHLKVLLDTLSIPRVDVLMAHSAGTWPVLAAVAQWHNVGSMMLVNPAGVVPARLLTFYILKYVMSWVLLWTSLWFITIPLMTFVVRKSGFKNVRSESGTIMNLLYTGNHDGKQVGPNAAKVHEKRIPIIVAYAVNDKVVPLSIAEDMIFHKLKIPRENVVKFTGGRGEVVPDRDPVFASNGEWISRALQFERGGHAVHIAHENEIVRQIIDLIKLKS